MTMHPAARQTPASAAPQSGRQAHDLEVLAEIAILSRRDQDLGETLSAVASIIRDTCGFPGVAVFVRGPEEYVARVRLGPADIWQERRFKTADVARSVRTAGGVFEPAHDGAPAARGAATEGAREEPDGWPSRPGASSATDPPYVAPVPRLPEAKDPLCLAAVPIRAEEGEPWGLLCAIAGDDRALGPADVQLLATAAAQLGVAVSRSQLRDRLVRQLRNSEALRTIAGDISSKLDLGQILSGLVDYALVLFKGNRAAVFLSQPDGSLRADVSRNLSEAYRNAVRIPAAIGLSADAIAQRKPLFATGYALDARSEPIRSAVLAEGYDTVAGAPLFDADGVLGLITVYHDERHDWTADELDTLSALAAQASVAIRTAENYAQMATWAAQLQSIQQLGTQLSRLTTVQEIGAAIASELRQLIDYQNVRVYRVTSDSKLIPVARHGDASLYGEETPEQLALAMGEGITGWVAEHGIAQNLPDAAHDPRTEVIPGTDAEVPESMLVAPMITEGRIIGVLVLSKLGLHQFGDDDLRLLVIYAMFAAQAMANAEATERLRAQSVVLEQQLRGQRELLHITESILSSLDAHAIVGQITERLLALVRYDRIAVELGDAAVEDLSQVAARETREMPAGLERGSSVLEVPLRSLGTVTGRLRLTRYGDEPPFTAQDVELVRLFAAHVSIALQNAEVHREVELRAQTDDLTGLRNQGTFSEMLRGKVAEAEPFSLIMLDLDDFKSVNDRMGHQAGDLLLQQIAWTVVRASRDSDVVFRYGGDEFVILLARTDAEGARQVAERIREALRAVRVGRRLRDTRDRRRAHGVTASIGIATFPEDGSAADEILLAADRACYVAKREGRDQIALAAEGRALAEEFTLQKPTPVDSPSVEAPRGRGARAR